MEGKIVVADFFFTRCPQICPQMTRNMKRLQDAVKKNVKAGPKDADFVQFISFTVDPLHDSVPELKKFADRYQINPNNWWLLTGDKKEIYDLARHEFFVNALEGEGGGPDDFIHTEKFVVIDKDRYIRGYYNGLDSNDVRRMVNDIAVLLLAKDKHRPGLLKRLFSSGN